MVSPLDQDCADFFRYTEKGQILPSKNSQNQLKAQETIKKLALDIDKLTRMREKAIEGLDINSLELDEIKLLIDGFEQMNKAGEYEEFCQVIIYILKQYIAFFIIMRYIHYS